MPETVPIIALNLDYYDYCVTGNFVFEEQKPLIQCGYTYKENSVLYCTSATEKGVYCYTYCLNNPLKYTDPSGDLWFVPLIAMGVGMAINAASYAIQTAKSEGGITSWDNGKFLWSLASGAASGFFSQGIGGVFGAVGAMGIAGEFGRAGMHALVQGTLSTANGGKFWTGAATGFTSSLVGSATDFLPVLGQIGVSTITGGLTSKLSGGTFWEGAATAAIISTLNHTLHAVINSTGEKINYRETLKKYNELVKDANGIPGDVIDLAKYLTKEQIVWLVKAGKISSWVGWGTIGLDAGLFVDAVYNGTPWGEHAYNAAIGTIGQFGPIGKVTANAIDGYVRAGKCFINTVNRINTEGNRMLMDFMKFLYTGN